MTEQQDSDRTVSASSCLPISSAPTAFSPSTRSTGSRANTTCSRLWRPHWLHPDTPPEGVPGARSPERTERLRAWIKDMAPEHYDRIRIPEKRQYSFHAFEALEFAYDRDADFAFKTALYDLMWTEGQRHRRGRDVCSPRPSASGSIRASSQPRLYQRVYAERALAAVKQAHEIGITNTPTIFLGRTRINGWTYYEVLQSVMEQQGMKPREALAA